MTNRISHFINSVAAAYGSYHDFDPLFLKSYCAQSFGLNSNHIDQHIIKKKYACMSLHYRFYLVFCWDASYVALQTVTQQGMSKDSVLSGLSPGAIKIW